MTSTAAPFTGVFAIPPTPFTDEDVIDFPGLERCVDFCIKAGADGLVTPVVASEFTALTDQERMAVVDGVLRVTADRVPVIVGVSGASTAHAITLTRHARRAGASAVIALPPYIRRASETELSDYYQRIAGEAEAPVFLQNYIPPIGTPMSVPLMVRLVETIENLDYIKEETALAPHLMTALLAPGQTGIKGVMGGMAGRNLVQEYLRGSCGTMPACEFVDIHVKIWRSLVSGDVESARRTAERLLPLLVLEQLLGSALVKEVLKARGVLTSANLRGPGVPPLDAYDRAELTAALDRLSDDWALAAPTTHLIA